MTIYSHSRLGTFEECPRRFWYRYVGKPEAEEAESVEAFLGSRVHEALEELYGRMMGGQTMTREQLLAFYEVVWDRNWNDGIRVVKRGFTPEDYRRVGREALGMYYRRYRPFDQSRTLRVEARFLIRLDAEGKYQLQGFIDRLAQRADGGYEVHDYKTSGRLALQEEADADRQLALYQIGVQAMWADVRRVDLIWHYLRFDKEIRSVRTPEELEAVRVKAIATIGEIEARGGQEGNFPTAPSGLCDWCEYQCLCPATRHHVAVAALPPEQFKADSGVRLVDAWVSARNRRRQLEGQATAIKAQEEEIQGQVIAFAAQEKLESLAGSSYHADVTEQQVVQCPGSTDENRAAFEHALRQAGLWDAVAAVNPASFKALWKNGEVPGPARQALQPFVNESTRTVARLKKGGREE